MSKKLNLSKSHLFKRTLPYIKKELHFVFTSLFLALVISVLSALTPFVTKAILDDFLPKENYMMIITYLLIYAGIIIVLAFSRYIFQFLTTLTGMHIEKRIREDAMEKINKLPVDYFSLEPDGKIVAKITSDSSGVRTFYVTLFSIINALLNIVIVYTGVIILQPILGLLILFIIPILVLWITLYRRKVHKYYLDLRETGSRITGKLNELITGTLTIQNYNQEDKMLGEYESLISNYVHNDRKATTINIYFGWELLSMIKRATEVSLLFFLGYSTLNVAGVAISIGLISAFSENLDKMINPINAIFNNLNELEDSLVGATRVYGFIDEVNDTRITEGLAAPLTIKGTVDFEHIRFAYVKDNYVLNDISLHVDQGQTIGIVGHTGSGKSSLMNLLLGYNDYQEGRLLVDGVDIKTYNKASYRKNLGIVLQSPALFAGTIKSNITMENNCYTDEEVIEVLKAVGGSYLLDKSPYGINQPISFRGENLSLGEKQIIAFARILLRNPKILVLDEATANIDSDTESKIKKAMDVISMNRTTFIIAHRLSTIKNADEIIVIDNGKIVGKGSHSSLYLSCSVYKDMYDSQFKNSTSL